jgi:hypothetical protein
VTGWCLYRALAAEGPATPGELGRPDRTNERYIREWLDAPRGGRLAGGRLTRPAGPLARRYRLPPTRNVPVRADP